MMDACLHFSHLQDEIISPHVHAASHQRWHTLFLSVIKKIISLSMPPVHVVKNGVLLSHHIVTPGMAGFCASMNSIMSSKPLLLSYTKRPMYEGLSPDD